MLRFRSLWLLLLLGGVLSSVADTALEYAAGAQTIANPDCQLSQATLKEAGQCRIQIGVINSFTDGQGTCSAGGVEHKRGYELALAELGELGGCQVELVAIDDKGSSSGAQAAVTQLAEAGVPLIIGAYTSGATLAAAAEADRLKIPLIVPSASSELITSTGYEWVFRISATSADYVAEALRLAVTLSESPSVGVLYENTVFGEGVAVAITSEAETLGISIVSYLPFQPGTPTIVARNYGEKYASLSTHVFGAKPDVIFLVSNSIEDALNLLKIGRLEALNPQLYIGVAGAFVTPDFLEQAGDEVENLVVTAQWSADAAKRDRNDTSIKQFVADFKAAYDGQMPGMRSVQAYTALFLARDAIEQAVLDPGCGGLSSQVRRECIRDVLRMNSWGQTLLGPVDFDDVSGQNSHQVLLVQVIKDDDGGYRFVTVYPEQYQTQPVTLEPVASNPEAGFLSYTTRWFDLKNTISSPGLSSYDLCC